MDKEIIKARAGVWKKSKELGRCICSSPAFPFPCPCPYFKEHKICKCNNEPLKDGDSITDWAEFNIKKHADEK